MLGLPVIRDILRIRAYRVWPTISLTVAEAQLGHDLAHFFGDEEHEVDHVLGLAGEFLAKLRVLRGDADGAGVEMADAHHDAAGGDQRRGAEADFFGAEQRRDRDIAAGLDLAVGLQDRRGRAGRSSPASAAFRRCPVPTGCRRI